VTLTEPIEVLTDAVMVRLTSCKKIVTLMFSIPTKCPAEDPVANIAALEVSSVLLYISFPENLVTDPIVMF
jgi:hypothetical protein